MSEEYSLEIVNPEKSFLLKDDVTEVVVPAYEGEIGILKDHISIISFLKPGIIKVFSKSGDDSYYVNDGIIEAIFEEPGKCDNLTSDPYGESSPESMLKYLTN